MSLLAIVGRPNVGKSTLFNRLVGMRQAIVDDISGVTRDRHYGRCEWCGHEFSVVDTGGYTTNSDDVFETAIREQVQIAIDEADAVLFMVEAATGVTDYDSEIADILRRSRKPVLLCVNKVDTGDKMYDAYQFYSLGLGELYTISAANGSGTGDLLDAVVKTQGYGCAPGILGVCIGGDRATGYETAKLQLLRPLDEKPSADELGRLEKLILKEANALGIGPMGLGGETTLLGVKIAARPRVPASFFVTVAYLCWAARRRTVWL